MEKRQISENFINRIKELKARTGLTNGEFAKKIGISTSALNNYLYGKTNDANGEKEERIPNIETSIKICELFGVSLDYLYGLDNCEHPNNEYISECTGLTDKSIEVLRQMNKCEFDSSYFNLEALNTILEDSYDSWIEKDRTLKRKHSHKNPVLYSLYRAIHSSTYKPVFVEESKDGRLKNLHEIESDKLVFHDECVDEYLIITDSGDYLKDYWIKEISRWIDRYQEDFYGEEALKDGKH